jgi:hypothetical protein
MDEALTDPRFVSSQWSVATVPDLSRRGNLERQQSDERGQLAPLPRPERAGGLEHALRSTTDHEARRRPESA